MTTIFLLGHRAQHGKNITCDFLGDLLESKKINYHKTYFAKLLKMQVAERYNLDFEKMEDNEYKNWCPPWIDPIVKYGVVVPRTVRQVLIDEGCGARAVCKDVWAASVYREIIRSKCEVGIVSDYRFPNEYICNVKYVPKNTKVLRVLVHRPDGIFKNDGADGELPDDEDKTAWDFIIYNNDKTDMWRNNIKNQLEIMVKCYLG